jgi:hypothetical protein
MLVRLDQISFPRLLDYTYILNECKISNVPIKLIENEHGSKYRYKIIDGYTKILKAYILGRKYIEVESIESERKEENIKSNAIFPIKLICKRPYYIHSLKRLFNL